MQVMVAIPDGIGYKIEYVEGTDLVMGVEDERLVIREETPITGPMVACFNQWLWIKKASK